MKPKIAVVVALAVLLQSSLRVLWGPLAYADLPLVVVVYFALRRDPVLALLLAAVAGLGTDALSGGLLGANSLSKSVTAYLIGALVTRFMIDNPLLRIPVLAGAAAFDAALYLLAHRAYGQSLDATAAETVAFKVIWTTAVGTFVSYGLDVFFSERGRQRRAFALRRRVARRTTGRRK